MSEFLEKDHYEIQNIAALFADNTDFNPVESVLFASTELFNYAVGNEPTKVSTLQGSGLIQGYAFGLALGIYVITEENVEKLHVDINDWINERVGLGVFDDEDPFSVYKNYTPAQKKKMIESSDDSILRIFMNQGHIWSTREVEIGLGLSVTELYPKRLIFKDMSENFIIPFTEHVVRMSQTDALDRATTKLIGQFVRENVTFKEYQRSISKHITENIRKAARGAGTSIEGLTRISLVLDKADVDYYIGLTLGDDGYYTLSDKIYSGEQTKVPKDALSDDEARSFKTPAVLRFPDAIIKGAQGNVYSDLKKDLEEFNDLEDTMITEYNFRFQRHPIRHENFLGWDLTDTPSQWYVQRAMVGFVNDFVTSSERIEALVTLGYIDFLISLISDLDDGSLNDTIMEHYDKAVKSIYTFKIQELIVFEKIISAKKKFFDNLAAATSEESPGGAAITEEEKERAYRNSLQTFKEGQGGDIPEGSGPSEEDVANRQKYFKQCALMLNMPELRDSYQQKLKQRYARKLPFGGRFTTLYAKDKEQETMLTSLVSSKNEQLLFELESWKVSKLVPKVRLFKVFHDHEKGEKEVEFIFDRSSNIRDTFMNPNVFDKGTGVGLKNFSFEFNGTTPATARNDITANLTLFFQSFQDFLRTRQGYSDEYRYVDLVIQPTPDKKGQYAGIDIQSDRQYEPQFYRIRADVGYVLPTEADGFSRDEIEAIRVSNKSFFLNMVDHDISFGKDGTVEIKISYRAYLESLLKHPRLDALASPELIARRIENAKTFSEQVQKRECSVDQLKELQATLAAQEEIILKQSLSSIITRLKNRGVIYKALIDKKDKEHFLKKGFFRKCELERTSQDDGGNGADVKLVLNSDLPESSEDFGFIDSANRSVQFFYFGDLLYTILDCVYDANDNVRAGTGYDRNSIILGSFEFEPFQEISGGSKVYNISDLPISVDFFSRWFVDNVMSQKSTRKTFPVMNFIRSLSNYLIKPSIIENCVNRKLETRLRFQTTQITAFEANGVNPISVWYDLNNRNEDIIALDVENLRTYGVLPLRGGPENDANSNFKDFHTFVVLSAIGSTLTYAGNGNYGEDVERGRFHVHVGQNAGLVKTLSLSKSDMQYIREARFFQNGIDGLLQLSAVYVANLEMFGNTLFYPGMEFFFNPFGIGGEDFNPTVAGSDANKLGIGGYHTITSVKSSITPGKFTTSISAQQYFSGDESGNPNIVKKKNVDREASSIDGYTPEDPNNEQGFANCKNVILAALNYDFEEGSTSSSVNSNNSTVASVEEPSPEDIVDEIIGATAEPSPEDIVDEIIGARSRQTPDEINANTSTITGEILNESPAIIRTYSGKLRTMISRQTTTSSTGGQLNQQFTEQEGQFTEMSDGTVYFQGINGNGSLDVRRVVRDYSRIIE